MSGEFTTIPYHNYPNGKIEIKATIERRDYNNFGTWYEDVVLTIRPQEVLKLFTEDVVSKIFKSREIELKYLSDIDKIKAEEKINSNEFVKNTDFNEIKFEPEN